MFIKNIVWPFLLLTLPLFAQPGQHLFDDTAVHTIELNFQQVAFYDSLVANFENERNIQADISIDGSAPLNIGARFKGYSSYMFYPGKKKSFKIDINEYASGQTYNELKKFNLHNAYLDPTFLREKLLSDFLLANDIPAPRVAFATVKVNGENWGLYTLVEQIDKTFLEDTWFGNDSGNLFKAKSTSLQWIGSNDSLYYNQFELKTNEGLNNWSDLLHFINRLNLSNDKHFKSSLDSNLQIDRYLGGWAARNLFVDLDTYFHAGNNFYLYNNSGKFEWICWDFNTALGTSFGWTESQLKNLSVFYLPSNSNRPLNKRILQNAVLRDQYVDIIQYFLQTQFTEAHLFAKIDHFSSLLRTHVQNDTLKMFSTAQFEDNLQSSLTYLLDGQFPILIPGLKDFLSARIVAVGNEVTTLGLEPRQSPALSFSLHQNYPNPFNPHTNIPFTLQQPANIVMELFDLTGRRVATILDGQYPPGHHEVRFSGKKLSSGIYIYRLTVDQQKTSKPMILLR